MIQITTTMTLSAFITALNANFTELCTQWECYPNSFTTILSTMDNEEFIQAANHNLRGSYLTYGMGTEDMVNALNAGFASQVRRFQDANIEDIFFQGEPTALVTDDGQQMDLWLNGRYTYTTDGISWAEVTTQVRSGFTYTSCQNVIKHEGVYYSTMVGITAEDDRGIHIFFSTDKYNWTHLAKLINMGANTGCNYEFTGLGNSTLLLLDGVWHFLYEAYGTDTNGWRIWLATCSTIDGSYTTEGEPVIPYTGDGDGTGNPEIATVNNRPYKYNGNYYMYYHYDCTQYATTMGIYRAYSPDLHTWTVEGAILDTRTPPAQAPWSNGDQAMCEFKGKTYFFYNTDGNGGGALDHTNLSIDNRPLSVILSLYP